MRIVQLVLIKHLYLPFLASEDGVEDHSSCNFLYDHFVDAIIADVKILVLDARLIALVASDKILACRPEELLFDMQRPHNLRLVGVKLKELLSLLVDAADALA